MPRRQHQEWIYACGHCGTETAEPLRLAEANDYGEAVMLSGPGWSLIIRGEEWFCSVDCFIAWLADKIQEAQQPDEDTETLKEDRTRMTKEQYDAWREDLARECWPDAW